MNRRGRQQKRAVCRGGSWNDNGRNLRSAYRNNGWHDIDNNGLRLARAHVAAGWRNRTRWPPVMNPLADSCERTGCRGVSNRCESPPRNRLFPVPP